MLSRLVFCLLFYLAFGTFVSLGFVRQSRLGRSYFIYHGLGACLVALGSVLLGGAPTWENIGFIAGAALFSLSAVKYPRLSYPLFILASAMGALAIYRDLANHPTALPLVLAFSNALLSALILGFSLAAMLLGHWYLVQPKLSIEELSRVSLLFIGLVFARVLFGAFHYAPLVVGKSEAEIYRYLLGSSMGIFVLMRFVWGLVGPLILAYLIWGTVKIRSTQSATGILYVAVLTVLTGEILALFLALFHGIAG